MIVSFLGVQIWPIFEFGCHLVCKFKMRRRVSNSIKLNGMVNQQAALFTQIPFFINIEFYSKLWQAKWSPGFQGHQVRRRL